MNYYLLDTNVFFDILEAISNGTPDAKFDAIMGGKCYISELTRIEIISVLGKHARGCAKQWQPCTRIINEAGDVCGAQFLVPEKKRWKKRTVGEWRKLIKDITEGNSTVFSVEVLPVTDAVCKIAGQFVGNALQYNFGSLDAMITATAMEHRRRTNEDLMIVTYDKKLLAAIRAEGTIPYKNPNAA